MKKIFFIMIMIFISLSGVLFAQQDTKVTSKNPPRNSYNNAPMNPMFYWDQSKGDWYWYNPKDTLTISGAGDASAANQDSLKKYLILLSGVDFGTSAKQDSLKKYLIALSAINFATTAGQDSLKKYLISLAATNFSTAAKQDSVLKRIDSLLYNTEGGSITIKFRDTTSAAGDTVSFASYKYYVMVTIAADDTVNFGTDVSYAATHKGWLYPGESFTEKIDPIAFPKYYYKSGKIATGTPYVRFYAIGR